ncbi:MAG: CerR family C-terminal domain-containing protein [Nitratireductor sp.]
MTSAASAREAPKKTLPGTQSQSDKPNGPEATRAALIAAALDLFGARGFEATSTREIAGRAGANIASIAYHFGGKEGLRQACAEAVRTQLGAIAAAAFADTKAEIEAAPDPEMAASLLEAIMGRFIRTALVSPQTQRFVPFVLREISGPSPVLELLYREVMEPTHKRLCMLWGAATGQPGESENVRLSVFALVGQAIYFRIGSEIVTRRMQWKNYTAVEADRIAQTVCANLRASIANQNATLTRKEKP